MFPGSYCRCLFIVCLFVIVRSCRIFQRIVFHQSQVCCWGLVGFVCILNPEFSWLTCRKWQKSQEYFVSWLLGTTADFWDHFHYPELWKKSLEFLQFREGHKGEGSETQKWKALSSEMWTDGGGDRTLPTAPLVVWRVPADTQRMFVGEHWVDSYSSYWIPLNKPTIVLFH